MVGSFIDMLKQIVDMQKEFQKDSKRIKGKLYKYNSKFLYIERAIVGKITNFELTLKLGDLLISFLYYKVGWTKQISFRKDYK